MRTRRRSLRQSKGFETGIVRNSDEATLANSAPRGPGHFTNERDRSRSARRLNELMAARARLTREVVSNTRHIAEQSRRPPTYFTVKRRMHEYLKDRGRALFASAFDVEKLWDIVQTPLKQVLNEVDAFRGAIGRLERQRGFSYATPELEARMRGQPLLSSRPLLRMGNLYLKRLSPELSVPVPKETTGLLFPDLFIVMDLVRVELRDIESGEVTSTDTNAKKKKAKKKRKSRHGSSNNDNTCTIWAVFDLSNARVETSTLAGRQHSSFIVSGIRQQQRQSRSPRSIPQLAELSAENEEQQLQWTTAISDVLCQKMRDQIPNGLNSSGVVSRMADWVFSHLFACGTAKHLALINNKAVLERLSDDVDMDDLNSPTATASPQKTASNAIAAAATVHHCAAIGGDNELTQMLAKVFPDTFHRMPAGQLHGPDGLAPVHCAIICANVPVLSTLLEPYVANGSMDQTAPATFKPTLAYQGVAHPFHLIPYALDAFQFFLVLKCCGSFDLKIPGFETQPWHSDSEHFVREYRCNGFKESSSSRRGMGDQAHLSVRAYAAIASMIHELSEAGLDINRVAPQATTQAQPQSHQTKATATAMAPVASQTQTTSGAPPDLPPISSRVAAAKLALKVRFSFNVFAKSRLGLWSDG